MSKLDLSTTYAPKEREPQCIELWEANGCFQPGEGAGVYTIVIPPPNVTDILHLGHALNNTIQDVLIRWNRMAGRATLWLPGTDHAGIATQHKVEEQLHAEDKTKEDVGRERFNEMLWEWNEDKGGRIIEQLKEIGCSADWTRTRFTLDEGFSKAVEEVFIRLYEQGLIYRGKYIVNHCPACRTALADEEVEHDEKSGKLWYIKYPLKDSDGHITVATTRPETMLGDTAVAVNPSDDRYKGLVGKKVILPLLNREIPIIADDFVEKEFGTGLVKVTPAHDPNDFQIGLRHDLEMINILTPTAILNKNAGPYEGLDRFSGRKKVVEDLKKEGLIEKIEDHTHSVGHCYRCSTVIEPYLSRQWFVKMKPLAEPAISLVQRGLVKFHPERWTGVYLNWLGNIRDWCISRQIWWGHQIPAYWCDECNDYTVAREQPGKCPHCGSESLQRDTDVLDTWFSSWLWPFATLGWPEMSDDLKKFYPTDTLVTAPEIIFFWVARMIMAGVHFMGELPFTDIYIHGTVRDKQGRKMSKSLGNGIDPLDVVDTYGRDALRFTLISQAAQGQDLYIDLDSFETGRNFINKLWNAARLLFMNLDDEYDYSELEQFETNDLVDRWVLSRLQATIDKCESALGNFRLDEYVHAIYHFFWGAYCNWALEAWKGRFQTDDSVAKKLALKIFIDVLKLLHPVVPFVTETLWQEISTNLVKGLPANSISIAQFPQVQDKFRDINDEMKFEFLQSIINAIRSQRKEMKVPPNRKGTIAVVTDGSGRDLIKENDFLFDKFANIERVEFVDSKPDASVLSFVGGQNLDKAASTIEVYLELGDLIDIDKYVRALAEEQEHLHKLISGSEKKLSNKNFLEKAPPAVVTKEQEKLVALKDKLEKLDENLKKFNS